MRIFKHIPNTITSLNLISGVASIIFAFNHDFEGAFYLILLASLFDFLDGLSARALKAYSDIGKELDSLADLISFGLAPALIIYNYLQLSPLHPIVCCIPLLIAPFSALRLAKFNLDTRQSHSFLGLPTPACALLCSSTVAFAWGHSAILNVALIHSWSLPIISIALSLALVSEIPMFSLKLKSPKWSENKILYLFILIAVIPTIVLGIVFHIHWSGLLMIVFWCYVMWNLFTLPLHRISTNRAKKTEL